MLMFKNFSDINLTRQMTKNVWEI